MPVFLNLSWIVTPFQRHSTPMVTRSTIKNLRLSLFTLVILFTTLDGKKKQPKQIKVK